MLGARRFGRNWQPRRLLAQEIPLLILLLLLLLLLQLVLASWMLTTKFYYSTEFTGNFLSKWQPQSLQEVLMIRKGCKKIGWDFDFDFDFLPNPDSRPSVKHVLGDLKSSMIFSLPLLGWQKTK